MPEELHGLRLPDAMRSLLKRRQWPALVRLGTLAFDRHPDLRFLKEIDLTFTELSLMASENEMARLPTNDEVACYNYAGSVDNRARDLPWLDIEKGLCIGGGADWGDDTWLVLDYREHSSEPRVVVNEWVYKGEDPTILWREIAPSFESFLQMMRSPDGEWVAGRFGDDRYAAYYSNLNEDERAALEKEHAPSDLC